MEQFDVTREQVTAVMAFVVQGLARPVVGVPAPTRRLSAS